MNFKNKGDILLLSAAIVGGMGFIGNKTLLNHGYSTFQVITGRFLLASLFMVIFFRKKLALIRKEELLAGGIMGIFLFGLFVLMMLGLRTTSASVNGFLVNLQSVFVPIILFVLYRTRIDIYALIGILLTVLGAGFLSFEGDFQLNIGVLLSLASSVCFALQMVATGKYVKNLDPVLLTMVENFVVLVLSVAVCFVSGEPLPMFRASDYGIFIAIGFFCTFLYFILQSFGQQNTQPTKAAILISSESVFSLFAAAFLLGERLDAKKYFGCLMLFFAILVTEIKPKTVPVILEKFFGNKQLTKEQN